MALSRAGLDAVAAGPVAAESLPSGGVYQNTHEKSTNAAGSRKLKKPAGHERPAGFMMGGLETCALPVVDPAAAILGSARAVGKARRGHRSAAEPGRDDDVT